MNKEQIESIRQSINLSDRIIPSAFIVNDVINELEKYPDHYYVLVQMDEGAEFSDFVTDSWRGSYDMPSIFKRDNPSTIKECVNNLKLTERKQVVGYKGGDYMLSDAEILFVERAKNFCSARAIIGIDVYEEYVLLKTNTDMY